MLQFDTTEFIKEITNKFTYIIDGIKNNVVRIINLIFKSEIGFLLKMLFQNDLHDEKLKIHQNQKNLMSYY